MMREVMNKTKNAITPINVHISERVAVAKAKKAAAVKNKVGTAK